MKNETLMGIIVALLAGGAIGGLTVMFYFSSLLDPQAVRVSSTDGGLALFVDGHEVGKGNVCLPWIPKGKHIFAVGNTDTQATIDVQDTTMIGEDTVSSWDIPVGAGKVQFGCTEGTSTENDARFP